jgi:transposase
MAYLEAGHTFDKVIIKLAEKHPNIKNPRIFARNVIRETTGQGVFDDYIFEHQLWRLRNPILAPPETHEMLKARWADLADKGRMLIEMDKKIEKALSKNDETAKMLIHVMMRNR